MCARVFLGGRCGICTIVARVVLGGCNGVPGGCKGVAKDAAIFSKWLLGFCYGVPGGCSYVA